MGIYDFYPENHRKLLDAVERLYYAAYWHPDRPCNSEQLWEDVRKAADLPVRGYVRLGPDRTVHSELDELLARVKERPPMTKEEIQAQRKSWVIGQMMLCNFHMTRDEAEEMYDTVVL